MFYNQIWLAYNYYVTNITNWWPKVKLKILNLDFDSIKTYKNLFKTLIKILVPAKNGGFEVNNGAQVAQIDWNPMLAIYAPWMHCRMSLC